MATRAPAKADKAPSNGLTVREAAAMLGIGQATLYERIGHDSTTVDVGWTEIRLIRFGRRIVIPRAEVERALCEVPA